MADRLTQLQDAVNRQAENLCNSIGILQQHATPSTFPGFERSGKITSNGATGGIGISNGAASVVTNGAGGHSAGGDGIADDYAKLFASLIARTAKDIDVLIDSLPSDDLSGELQIASLKKLEKENQEAAQKLEGVVRKGERLLEQIQAALHDIAQSQLETARLFQDAKT